MVCDCRVQAVPRPETAPGDTCEPGEPRARPGEQGSAQPTELPLFSGKDDATDDKSRLKM